MSSAEPKRILFAHNGTETETAVLDALFQLNYGIIPAENLSEATEASGNNNIDLVLASATGEVNGFALCDEIRGSSKNPDLPVVLTGGSSDDSAQFVEHQEKETHANGYIQHPVSTEEVVDWVERLIGLPPPPDSGESLSGSSPIDSGEVKKLERRVEELQEQVHHYQVQANEVSQSGEKSVRDLTNVLNDLQDDLDKVRGEKEAFKDEMALLKSDLAKKERDGNARIKLLEDLKVEGDRRIKELSSEVEEARKTFSEAEQKHKRAIAALREYYRGKTSHTSKLEKRAEELEADLKESSSEVKRLTGELQKTQKIVDKAKSLFS